MNPSYPKNGAASTPAHTPTDTCSPETGSRLGGDLTLSPFYHSAVNSITEPDKYVFLSRYLVERWLPDLGPNAFAIVCFLRRLCYHNRKTGEMRNSQTVAMTEIAQGCQLSVSTVRRELQNNTALQRFVAVQAEYAYDDQRGGFRKDKNSYTVSMDDPLHPADEALLQERVREIAALREKAEQDPIDDETFQALTAETLKGIPARPHVTRPHIRPKTPSPGFVYLLSTPQGHYKIGKARHVGTRLTQLAPTLPFDVTLEHSITCDDYTSAERAMHTQFAPRRLNGEWFALTEEDVIWIKGVTCWPGSLGGG